MEPAGTPKRGGWLQGLRDKGASLSARALAVTSSAAKRVQEAAASFSARGSTTRAQPIDESSPDWRARAGRASGPDTYVHGDLCSATFRRALALSPQERDLLYCGAVLLLGVLEADGLRGTEKGGPPSPYASLSLEDTLGYDVRAEHQLTRTIPGTPAPQWDEVFAVGQRLESFDDVARVRLTVKSYGGALGGMGGNEKLGMAHLRLDELMETEAGGGAWTEKWVPLQADAGAGTAAAAGGGLGRLRVAYLFHRPPSTPQPVAVGASVVCAHALPGGEGHAHYVTVAALNKIKGRVRAADDAPMRQLRGASVRDGGAAPSFSDVFELHDIANGGVSGDVAGGAAGAWGWPGGRPHALLTAATVRPLEVALADSATELQVSVWEEGVALNVCVGEVCVPFASLWGHEDAVAHECTLRIARWYRLAPPRSLLEGVKKGGGGGGGGGGGEGGGAAAGGGGGGGGRRPAAGRVFLDMVLRFAAPLLPPGWVEAVCTESGDAYFYNEALRVAQWEPPAWPLEGEGGAGASSGGAAAALLRDGARTRGASASWAAEGGVMGASAAASSDLVAGDSPHKPPRPRALRAGAVSGGSSTEARLRALAGSGGGGGSPREAAAGGEGGGDGSWPRPPPPAEPAAKHAVNPFNMKISPLAGGQKRWASGSGAALGGGAAAAPGGPLPTLAEAPAYISAAAPRQQQPAPAEAPPAKTPAKQAPPPAPAPAKSGGGESDEDDGGDDDAEAGAPPSAPSEADLDAAAAGGSRGAAARAEAALLAVPEFNNPLAGMPRPVGGAGGHREGDFFKALAKNAAEKKAAQEAEKAVRFAAWRGRPPRAALPPSSPRASAAAPFFGALLPRLPTIPQSPRPMRRPRFPP
jgi:hypothetical protein